MIKTVSTHFVLRRKGDKSPISKGNRVEMLELFSAYCEAHPKDFFSVTQVETFSEVIVKSEDNRQSLLKF